MNELEKYLKKVNKYKKSITQTGGQGGLIINGKTINRISGPVSMYCCYPKDLYDENSDESKDLNENNFHLPVIILFGDHHFSNANMCDNCVRTQNCYIINDQTKDEEKFNFLELLDKLAEKIPVDFYTEQFITNTLLYASLNNSPLQELVLSPKFNSCYQPQLPIIENECPTKYIKWHGSDIRFSIRRDYHNPIKTQSENFESRNFFEGQFFFIFMLIYDIVTNSDELLTKSQNVISAIKNSHFKTFGKFFELISFIKTNENLTFNIFATNLFLYIQKLKNFSLIYKQIQKQKLEQFKKIDFWKDQYVKSLNFVFLESGSETQSWIESKTSYFKQTFEFMFNLINLINKTVLENNDTELKLFLSTMNNKIDDIDDTNNDLIKTAIIYIQHIFMEIYTVLRILKQPKDNTSSCVSFCYFGSYHINNMVRIIKSLTIYLDPLIIKEADHSKKADDISRCIDIKDKFINLDNIAEQYIKKFNIQSPKKAFENESAKLEEQQTNTALKLESAKLEEQQTNTAFKYETAFIVYIIVNIIIIIIIIIIYCIFHIKNKLT